MEEAEKRKVKGLLLSGLLFCLLPALSAQAADDREWTATNTGLQAVYATLHIMDWAQTQHIARNPDKYNEHNLILGEHPSEGRVNSYFAITLMAHTGIAYLLPKPWREMWQVSGMVVETHYIEQNKGIGINISLRF